METTTNPEATMTITTSQITAKGNAVAFTANGETIVAGAKKISYCPRRWYVSIAGPLGISLTDSRNETFATKAEAAEYATSLLDAAKTEELAWW